ncbi:hypothetical protein CVT25_000105 [Psilocybe cyanescens]|uniref:Uncharacterized protein n=1 Tax=Psilocybe cyanescens TaxID=93625 RepID=A0A409XQG1_PSICY|nr:hypothetical protein CVT25_000105 [Psilocybe cyanescens]
MAHMSSAEQPQVQEQALWKRGGPVPEKVFGFIFSHNRKLAWANKHNIAPEQPEYIRVQLAWNAIARQLPTGHRRLALVHDDKSPVICLVIANNKSETEMAKTKDQALIKAFQKVVGEERQPQWFHQTF